jgi:hypothetical protein
MRIRYSFRPIQLCLGMRSYSAQIDFSLTIIIVMQQNVDANFCQAGVVAPPDSPTDGNFRFFGS